MFQPKVGIIILAAGGSIKLGDPKQLVMYQGKTLFRRSVESALRSGPEAVIAVLGSRADELLEEASGFSIVIEQNDNWKIGISSSIKVGLTKLIELRPKIDAAVIMLSDQPFVDERTIGSLIENYKVNRKPIVCSEYNGVLGVPALFDRVMFEQLMDLEGDAGARVIIRQYSREKIITISAPEAAFDVDSPEDLEKLNRMATDPVS